MSRLSDQAKAAIAQALREADHGGRKLAAERLADTYGISVSTVYRAAKLNGTKRPRAPTRPEYREWVAIAVRYAHQAPKPVPIDLAISGAVEAGSLPPEALDMPIQTVYRIRLEERLLERSKRTHRLFAEYPMQAVQVDGSSSQHLVAARPADDGDWVLKLHRRPDPAGGYKNKPLGEHRMRVYLYALWDMCTGYTLSRYVVAKGENALDACDFLCWAMSNRERPEDPLHGVPDNLWSDQGPLFKSGPARDLLERLDINFDTSKPYQKTRMGGVERTHRTRWERFERALFLRDSDEILLSEANERLAAYDARENGRRDSRTPVGDRTKICRTDAWIALTNARPADNRLRRLPDNPMQTLARESRRRIDVNGIVRWDGRQYECVWHDRWVIARRPMDADAPDRLILECERTGDRTEAEPLRRRYYGDIRSGASSDLDRLLDDDTALPGADIYARGESASRVSRIPVRADLPDDLDNPLDAGRYRTLEEALQAFHGIYPWPLSPSNRAAVIARIEDAGLDRAAVAQLGADLLSLSPQQRRST